MASKMRGSMQRLIELQRALERDARFLRHHPVIGEHQGLALPRQTLRRFSQQPDRLAVGIGRIAIAPPAHIDRGDRVPALALLGMLAEPRFDAGDERFEVLVARGILRRAASGWSGMPGRAVGEIEAEREQRQRDRRPRWSPSWCGACRLKSCRTVALSPSAASSRRAISIRAASASSLADQRRAPDPPRSRRADRDRRRRRRHRPSRSSIPGARKRAQQDEQHDCREAGENDPKQHWEA